MPREPLDRSVYEVASNLRPEVRSRYVFGQIEAVLWRPGNAGFVYTTSGPHGPYEVVVSPFSESLEAVDRSTLAEMDLLPSVSRPHSAGHGAQTLRSISGDLFLQSSGDPKLTRLTEGGSARNRFGAAMESNDDGVEEVQALAVWSTDGQFALSQRLDYRDVRATPITEACPAGEGAPLLHHVIDPFPGDKHIPHAHPIVVDTLAKTCSQVEMPSLAVTHSSPFLRGDCWWDEQSQSFFMLRSTRDWLRLQLWQIDPVTSDARMRFEERSARRIRPSQYFHQRPNVRLVHGDDGGVDRVIWFSERSGWGHLYLMELDTGAELRQLTDGEFVVQQILRFDEPTGKLWLLASGLIEADPYRWSICECSTLDNSVRRLVSDELDHRPLVSPDRSASYFIDIASTVETPPIATVRSWDGDVLMELPSVDVSSLREIGWQTPERFVTTAADGQTRVYGTLFRPPHFDPSQRYPVLDHLYPGPQVNRSAPYFAADEIEPLVALGIVGVTIDGRGTPGRSRAFHDVSHGNLGAASGIADHVAALRELAETRPWMDLSRMAAFGHSAGGFAVTRAMELFPEFYGVGISQCGRHDGRLAMAMILEAYDDPYDAASWARASGVADAHKIAGKLLLVHGEINPGITVHNTLRLIDALIEANRDFDLLIVPGDDHSFTRRRQYVDRRCWDYLVRELLDQEPPRFFEIPDH